MSTEDNKAVVRRWYDIANSHNLDRFDEVFADDLRDHNPQVQAPGVEGVKQFFDMLFRAFPDLHMTVGDLIAEGDKVAVRVTAHGTHRGDFQGIPATGKPITIAVIDVIRLANGKMVEHWGQTDNLGMLQQLGVMPAPQQAPA